MSNTDEFPATVTYEGHVFYKTGKHGRTLARFFSLEAEYKHARSGLVVWATSDGKLCGKPALP